MPFKYYFIPRKKTKKPLIITPTIESLQHYLTEQGVVDDNWLEKYEKKHFEYNGREGYHFIPKKKFANYSFGKKNKKLPVIFSAITEQDSQSMYRAYLIDRKSVV